MANTISLNNRAISLNQLNSAQLQAPGKSLKLKSSKSLADKVEISSSSAKNQALRTLSDASTRVNVSEAATKEIESLLKDASSISKTLSENSVSPEQESQLKNDIDTIFSQVDSIVTNTKVNDTPVADSGALNIKVNFNSDDNNSSSEVSIFIANVGISRSDLGISTLTSNDIASDPSGSKKSIDNAVEQLQTTKDSLQNSRTQIASAVEEFASNATNLSNFTFKEAKQTAITISEQITATDSIAQKAPEPLRVNDLLQSA